jgi:hypothetical protein
VGTRGELETAASEEVSRAVLSAGNVLEAKEREVGQERLQALYLRPGVREVHPCAPLDLVEDQGGGATNDHVSETKGRDTLKS